MHNTRIQTIVQNKTLTDDVINGVRSTVCSCQTFQGDRNGGLLQVGCLYAWNMQNEQSKDILESCFMHLSAFELILLQTNEWIIFSLLFVVTLMSSSIDVVWFGMFLAAIFQVSVLTRVGVGGGWVAEIKNTAKLSLS